MAKKLGMPWRKRARRSAQPGQNGQRPWGGNLRKATIAIARTDRVKLLGQNMVLPGQRRWYPGTHKTDMLYMQDRQCHNDRTDMPVW